jgi:hypothetical protein
MPVIANIDGTPLTEAEEAANEIFMRLFALRNNPTLHAALAKLDHDKQHELELAVTDCVQAAIDNTLDDVARDAGGGAYYSTDPAAEDMAKSIEAMIRARIKPVQ